MKKLFFFSLLLFFNNSFAQVSWDGGAGTNKWNHANNWNPNGVPTATDDVEIHLAGATVIVPANHHALAATISIQSGAMLRINLNASLTIDGSGTSADVPGLSLELHDDNRLLVIGSLKIRNANHDGILVERGQIYNKGSIQIDAFAQGANYGSSGIRLYSNTTAFNDGLIQIRSNVDENHTDGILVNNARFMNLDAGEIQIKNIFGIASEGISNLGEFNNWGKIQLDSMDYRGIYNTFETSVFRNMGNISISNTANGIEESRALYEGGGSVTLSKFDVRGAISPGLDVTNWSGELIVNGHLFLYDYTTFYDAESTYKVDLLGTGGAGEFDGNDVISEINDLTLGGNLVVRLRNGFVPVDTDEFTILKYSGALVGVFDTVDLPSPSMDDWIVDYAIPGRIVIRKPPVAPKVAPPENNIIANYLQKDKTPIASSFRLFPNPTNQSTVTIKGEKIEQLRIYNHLGKLIKEISLQTPINQYRLAIANWNAGTYFIHINGQESLRLIVF